MSATKDGVKSKLWPMLEELPSLLGFQPKFYIGGPTRFHLPLAYDLVATGRPQTVVTLGFGDGEIHFAFCQAARENQLPCRLVALRNPDDGLPEDDNAWQAGLAYNSEFYGDVSNMSDGSPEKKPDLGAATVDLLFLNDCDSYEIACQQWNAWAQKISPNAIILIHGIGTKRAQGIAQFWNEIKSGGGASVEFSAGSGLGVICVGQSSGSLLPRLFQSTGLGCEIELVYQLAAARIEHEAKGENISRENRLLQLRQVWLPTLLDGRIQMQNMIDHLNRHIAHIERVHASREAELHHQQSVLETALKEKEAAIAKLKTETVDLNARLAESTRKNEKKKRSVPEKIAREIQRIPKNLQRLLQSDIKKKTSRSENASRPKR